jgi:hypothetical protein
LPQLEICGLEVASIDGCGTFQHLSSRDAGFRILEQLFDRALSRVAVVSAGKNPGRRYLSDFRQAWCW